MSTQFSIFSNHLFAEKHHVSFVFTQYKRHFIQNVFILVIVESYKNTPPLNEDSVLFTKDRTSIGKVSNHYTSLANFISQTFVTIHKMICCFIRWWYIVHCNYLSYCVIINSFVGLNIVGFSLDLWSVRSSLSALLCFEVQLSWRHREERS